MLKQKAEIMRNVSAAEKLWRTMNKRRKKVCMGAINKTDNIGTRNH